MSRNIPLWCLLPLLLLGACVGTQRKKLNRYLSLSRKEKTPYGLYYAFETLPALFPDADIRVNSSSPTTFYYPTPDASDDADSTRRPTANTRAFISIARNIDPEGPEVSALVNMATSGEQVMLCSAWFGDSLLHRLKCDIHFADDSESAAWSVRGPVKGDSLRFSYPGDQMNFYFSLVDSGNVRVIGWNAYGSPDFIRIGFPNRGAIFLHLAPLAFSNFFLLHKQNKTYYDYAMSYLPRDVKDLRWDEYFRLHNGGSFSALKFILSQRALRWAFWLIATMLFLLYVFESKRKQRAQPRIAPPANASVGFVKTVGRLYFQQKNNQDLAVKMIAVFLEQLYGLYRIPVAELNEAFSQKLAYRSGQPLETVQQLVYAIHYARLNPGLRDDELLDLHRRLTAFKKIIA